MPKRRLILGTAGHVDHGKTKLIEKLTGVDTDRLKEEKERGISIELGFAPLKLSDDVMIGIVDVPGHERFVKHMVAGAGGIDMALLVVAADEGVMPQTREHLEVLRSLAIDHGVIVITKADLGSPDTKDLLDDDIAELVNGTFLESAPVIETSVVSGEGMEQLKQTLGDISDAIPDRDIDGPFRLAIDRVFHKQGIGVVITGSCYSGKVEIGDSLQLLPSEKNVRVREIQSFAEKRQTGYAGERLAIALQGGKLGEVERGDMLVTPTKFMISYMIDARVRIASYAKFEIKQRERLRIHHGAREVFGRVTLLEGETLGSGQEGLAQLRLETPIVGAEGDFIVLRKYSPSRVVGGGRIIDPRAKKHRRSDASVVENLKVLEEGDPMERIVRQVQSSALAGVKAATVDHSAIQPLLDEEQIVTIEKILFHKSALTALADHIHELAADYNKRHPLRYGIDKEELRQRVGFPHAASMFNRVLERIAKGTSFFISGNAIRAGTEEVELPNETLSEIQALEELVKASGFQLKRQADMLPEWKASAELPEALQYLRDTRRVDLVGNDLYIHTDTLMSCLDKLREWFATHPSISVPEFKDLLGVTRKQAIPLLEYLDADRYTARRENVRVPGAKLR